MIDQDYAELLNRSPPSGDVLEWTFSTRTLANFFATLLLGTPALCLALYYALAGEEDPSKGAFLRVSDLFVFVSAVSTSDRKQRPVCTGIGVTMQCATCIVYPSWCMGRFCGGHLLKHP